MGAGGYLSYKLQVLSWRLDKHRLSANQHSRAQSNFKHHGAKRYKSYLRKAMFSSLDGPFFIPLARSLSHALHFTDPVLFQIAGD